VFVASTAPTATAASVLISVIIFVLSFLIAKAKLSETQGGRLRQRTSGLLRR
jgi:hypothetical protein